MAKNLTRHQDGAVCVGGIPEVEEKLENAAEFSSAEVEIGFLFHAAQNTNADRQYRDEKTGQDEKINDARPQMYTRSILRVAPIIRGREDRTGDVGGTTR